LRRKSFTRQLYPSYLLITLFSLVAVGWYASTAFREFYLSRTTNDLTVRADLMRERLRVLESFGDVDALLKNIGPATNTRYTLVDQKGLVLGDSQEFPKDMENHADRLEIKKALKGDTGISIRFSRTLQKQMMYVALPLKTPCFNGVLRAAIPLLEVSRLLESILYRIALAGFLIALLAAFLGWIVSQKLVRPLREMRDIAGKFARGELDERISISSNEEMAALATSMNLMARQLHERIETIAGQKNEMEALLSSMTESLLAVDTEARVIKVNQAAMNLLQMENRNVFGKSIQEVLRNTELQELVKKTLASSTPIEGEIVLHDPGEHYWQVHGNLLIDANGKRIGALLVLNDVTKLRRLEGLRRDFVANVSHELKTPITSIKGFVETLLEGAWEDREKVLEFLKIVARQSDRLNAIIDDLLSLSRIEQEAEKGRIPLEEKALLPLIQLAVESCRSRALRKRMTLKIDCSQELKIRVNASLLEQALVNLIDNAIKYSPEGGVVQVNVTFSDVLVNIAVKDGGPGISREHLDRLFERFYRVDKARSRKLGGTGLGLAIVKHIAQAHGGRVSVESRLNEGSVFCLHLPR
jgi:two-component system phosphate regulon sensor histidine kinase PhoR